ncbi:hypothetical protein AK95_07490 [Paenibacillus sp. LC231]|nr:hypothetical protein AK95_07490 [Paenibacillus sp. LC231]
MKCLGVARLRTCWLIIDDACVTVAQKCPLRVRIVLPIAVEFGFPGMNLSIVEIQTQRRPLPLLQYTSALSAGLEHSSESPKFKLLRPAIIALPCGWSEWCGVRSMCGADTALRLHFRVNRLVMHQ